MNPCRRLLVVLVVAVSLVGVLLSPSTSYAAVGREVLKKCAPGPNGSVCAAIRTDGRNLRARAGAESYTGVEIWVYRVVLVRTTWVDWQRTTSGPVAEAEPGRAGMTRGPHIDVYTPVVAESCDRGRTAYTYQTWDYYRVTSSGGGSRSYSLSSAVWGGGCRGDAQEPSRRAQPSVAEAVRSQGRST